MSFGGTIALSRFENPEDFVRFAMHRLHPAARMEDIFPHRSAHEPGTSAVLFPLGNHCAAAGFRPCLILNKRSALVRQSGDLCCPGGSISTPMDRVLSSLLSLPGWPLHRWPHWPAFRRKRPRQARHLALLLATSLRESLEEMRLNPLGVRFIGPLPAQELVLFPRAIYPMAGWITRQRHFFPNREVSKVVQVPVEDLLNPANYARYRLRIAAARTPFSASGPMDYPCFLHRTADESELLWGVTYRITVLFLERVFGFAPPDPESLPVVNGTLDDRYVNGPGTANGQSPQPGIVS